MKNFKGFNDWIEIFKGGKQTDSNGKEHDGDGIIDKVVSTFNAAKHEPPLVIGHPKDNDPAYGWVEDVKSVIRNGEKYLLMKAKKVVSEFEEMVRQGLFKKRSISVYPDGSLRHVGFLGAAPPAVKGLADLKFSADEEALTFDFNDPQMGTFARILRNLRDWLIEKEGKETADSIIPDWDVEYIREEANKDNIVKEEENMGAFKEKIKGLLSFMGVDMSKVPDDALPDSPPAGSENKAFTEADLERIKKEAEEKGKKNAEADFKEKERKAAKKARDKEISDYVDQGIKDGKILPAWKDAGLTGFMQGLDAETEIEFKEGEDKKTGITWFREFLEGFSKAPIFREMAKKESAASDFSETAEKELGESIAAKVNR
ncbi:MAG: hypothetical protein JW944_11385 [Deltaproteobacteria bacterium]|nr:hypothetical protein [Deltaproteobacteria bacterium]